MSASRALEEGRAKRRRAGARARITLAVLLAGIAVAGAAGWRAVIRMPGQSWSGPQEPLSDHERDLERALRRDVQKLAGEIGDRSMPHPEGLAAAADFVERSFTDAGLAPGRQRFEVGGKGADNIEAEIKGGAREAEIVLVGAHYDSVAGTVGADDNGSGVAALLALARAFAHAPRDRTLRFVAFANEEPPYFQTSSMGSVVYARRCRERGERIVAMLSLETVGFYTDQPSSQHYPAPFSLFYPTTGDFVAFVGNSASADLVCRSVASFRAGARFPSEGIAAPEAIPGVGWSDQWAFWQQGYPGVMISDTAPFRNPRYHQTSDTPDQLTYPSMARVVAGLERVVADLASAR